jgi:hypothetical protein
MQRRAGSLPIQILPFIRRTLTSFISGCLKKAGFGQLLDQSPPDFKNQRS